MKKIILSLSIFFILIMIIISPQTYIETSFNAISVWAKILLPSLFPFLVFTKLLTSLGYVKNISNCFEKITYKLYKTPPISSYVFFMSILTGYPVGSKLIADLYSNGALTKQEAKKCITFTSNSGPMFIIGSVGLGMLECRSAGYIILISHILGSLLNGLIYRNMKNEKQSKQQIEYHSLSQDTSLASCVSDSVSSILLIGGIIIIAFITIEVFNNLNIFQPITVFFSTIGISEKISTTLLSGLFEITKGCILSSALPATIQLKTIISCAIISFGGLSTVLQAMAFLKNICTYKFFILQKITHMLLSTAICAIFCIF